MNKYRITNPNNNKVRDCKSRTTEPFVVELKEDVSNLPSESYEFIVSEDIEIVTEDVTELEFSKILVKKGKYPCDPKIGEFGGYIIPLYGIK